MKVAVAAMGESLDSQVSGQFGRCPCFVIVDRDTFAFQVLPNPGAEMSHGAGTVVVSEISRQGAEVVLAGRIGPKAQQALETAGMRFKVASGSVREAVADCSV